MKALDIIRWNVHGHNCWFMNYEFMNKVFSGFHMNILISQDIPRNIYIVCIVFLYFCCCRFGTLNLIKLHWAIMSSRERALYNEKIPYHPHWVFESYMIMVTSDKRKRKWKLWRSCSRLGNMIADSLCLSHVQPDSECLKYKHLHYDFHLMFPSKLAVLFDCNFGYWMIASDSRGMSQCNMIGNV